MKTAQVMDNDRSELMFMPIEQGDTTIMDMLQEAEVDDIIIIKICDMTMDEIEAAEALYASKDMTIE